MFTKSKRRRILQKYNGRCAYCGRSISMSTMSVDHLVPKCKGGTGAFDNLLPSCLECNHLKNNDDISVFRYKMAWDSLKVTDLASYDSMVKAVERYKFYFEIVEKLPQKNNLLCSLPKGTTRQTTRQIAMKAAPQKLLTDIKKKQMSKKGGQRNRLILANSSSPL